MSAETIPEPKTNIVTNGGARIVVDDDDEILRYGLYTISVVKFDLTDLHIIEY